MHGKCLFVVYAFLLLEISNFHEFRAVVSFNRPRELPSFDPRHVTRSPPIGKDIQIGAGRYNKGFCDPKLFYYRSIDLDHIRNSSWCLFTSH